MDLTFRTDLGRFNIRVCAVMIHQEALLIMRDEAMPHAYLPGGRIQFQETAEAALQRELKEELKIEAEILRPLWLCQSFFLESSSQEKFKSPSLICKNKRNTPVVTSSLKVIASTSHPRQPPFFF